MPGAGRLRGSGQSREGPAGRLAEASVRGSCSVPRGLGSDPVIYDRDILFSFVVRTYVFLNTRKTILIILKPALTFTAVSRDDNAWEIFNDGVKTAASPRFVLASISSY